MRSTPCTTEYESLNMPPVTVQAPMAITYFGSGSCSYKVIKAGAILRVIVPAVIIKSACRGVALKTSEPKREISNLDMPTCIISIAQQEVPKVSGQTELERAKLAIGSRKRLKKSIA